jgi:hypothetical protein
VRAARPLPRLEVGFVGAALALAAWGAFASGADPVRTRVLVEESGAHDPHGPWGLQTVEASLELRPWHPGYPEARTALHRLTKERRRAVRRW